MSNFKYEVYKIVKKIPKGKVVTYGQIAQIISHHRHLRGEQMMSRGHLGGGARAVGNALHKNTDPSVPCHRVVDRNGRLAPHFAFDGAQEQRRRLLTEWVKFADNMHVDMKKSIWGKEN